MSASAGSTQPVFQLLLLANFGDARGNQSTAPRPIDKVSFDDVLAEFEPRVELRVTDYLGATQEPLGIDLTFRSLNDFHPRAILEQSRALRPCFDAAQALQQVARGACALSDVAEAIGHSAIPARLRERIDGALTQAEAPDVDQSSPGSPPAAADILGSVGAPDAASGTAKTTVDALIERMGIASQDVARAPHRHAATTVLAELEVALHRQLDAILHHPDFQSLEAAWRGCQLLVSRADFHGEPIALYIASCPREQLPDALRSGVDHIAKTTGTDGIDAVITDFVFDQTAGDVELLTRSAAVAEETYTTLVVGGSSRLLGGKDGSVAERPPSLRSRFDAPDLIEWHSLREQPAAQYVVVVMPEVLARYPYGAKTIPVSEIGYEEQGGQLWTCGAWAVGAVMLQSVARTGWPLAITGPQDGVIEDLPIAPVPHGAGRTLHLPAPTVWTDEEQTELARAGLAVLAARAKQNKLWVMSAATLAEPEPAANAAEEREARLHATLPYRLFGNRIARRLDRIQEQLTLGMDDSDIEVTLLQGLGVLFKKPGTARVEVSPTPDDPDVREALVQILPEFRILGREVNLMLSLEVS